MTNSGLRGFKAGLIFNSAEFMVKGDRAKAENAGQIGSNWPGSANRRILLGGFCALCICACSDSNPTANLSDAVEQEVANTADAESAEIPAIGDTENEDETADGTVTDGTANQAVPPAEVAAPVDVTAQRARYSLTFEATWSVGTHPVNFPFGPHFSGLVGAVHSEQVVFWEPGQLASNGVEVVAESGAKTAFLEEIGAAVNDGRALSAIDEGGIADSPGERSIEFEVTADYPLITLLSMLAPSPDWIVGVHGLNLLQNGEFRDSVTVELELYDAGTDSGSGFLSANEDTQPRDIINLVSSDPADTDFIEGLPSVGSFRIVRQ